MLTDTYSELNNNSSQQPSSFTDADNIVNFLKNNHYVFNGVSGIGSITNPDYSKISYGNFNNDETQDQNFVLHFKHATAPTTDERIATETINYVYGNGTKQGLVAAPTSTTDVKFTRTGTKDLVTTQVVWDDWKANSESLPAVKSPTAQDPEYSLIDKTEIPAIKLNIDNDGKITTEDNAPLTYTVHYYAPEHAQLTFYDDTNGQSLTDYLVKNKQKALLTDTYSELNNNSSKQPISFTDADSIVNFLKNNDYVFNGVSGDGSITNPDYSKISYGNFDNNETQESKLCSSF